MQPIQIFAGLALLVYGRKLFWFLAGAAVFYISLELASRAFPNQPGWMILLAAAVAGLAGALLSVYVQSLAAGIAGFLAGGYILSNLVQGTGIDLGRFSWFVFAAGGLAGGFLVLFLLEWALILLTSFAGALLVVQRLPLNSYLNAFLFFAIFLTGFGLQVSIYRREEVHQRHVEGVEADAWKNRDR